MPSSVLGTVAVAELFGRLFVVGLLGTGSSLVAVVVAVQVLLGLLLDLPAFLIVVVPGRFQIQ